MDLSKIKSAVILTDLEEAREKLLTAAKHKGSRITGAEIVDGALRVRAVQRNAVATKERISDMQARTLAEAAGLRWNEEMKGRTVPYWMSDERPDAHGDIVRQNWLFDLFDKNPVSVFSHDWGGLPIGAIIHKEVLKRADVDYQGPGLFGQDLFAPRSISEFADDVFKLVDAGFLRGCSVGFVSDKVIVVTDDAERSSLGLGQYGVILDQNHLLELSPTTLGANPGAHSVLASLAKAKQRGALTASSVAVIRELTRQEMVKAGDRDGAFKADAQLVAVARGLIPQLDIRATSDVEKSLLDREEWDKARRTWVNVSVATEDDDGDEKPDEGDEKPDEKPDEGDDEEAKARGKGKVPPPLKGDDDPECMPNEVDDEENASQKGAVLEMLNGISELLLSLNEHVGRLAQTSEDVRAMIETMATARAEARDDESGDGDDSSSVDPDVVRAAGEAIDRLRAHVAG